MSSLVNRHTPPASAPPTWASWLIAGVFPLLLLALSFLRIIGDAGSAAFGGAILNSVLTEPIWGTALGYNLTGFALALVLVHLSVGLLCLIFASLARLAWPHSSSTHLQWTLLWLCLISVWVLIANAALFPASSLGTPYTDVVTAPLLHTNLFVVASLVVGGSLVVTLLAALKRMPRHQLLSWPGMVVISGAVGTALIVSLDAPASSPPSTTLQPNIILIGLDSLRTDALKQGRTPAIDQFMSEAIRFTDATTPLARTFPAWVSLISGKHPHTTGATINLLPRDLINTGDTLPGMLSNRGFQTLYAIDEVRFSNLDTSYGFQKMAAPRIGATDFLLGFFADTPLSNLLTNTAVGRWLFPYTHGNRAATVTYDPDVFLDGVLRALPERSPMLLATHLTLAHWPYSWADSRRTQAPADTNESALIRAYANAVARLDQQFYRLLTTLEQRGALRNAIVVVFSDHGESLGEGHDEDDANTDKYFGHGTSVFARDQYHVVLGFRAFGNAALGAHQGGRDIHLPVSLEDITPTLFDALAVDSNDMFDGRSLLPLIRGEAEPHGFADRIRFTETEFNPPGIAPGTLISASALANAAKYYQVDPRTDRITISRQHIERIKEQRQFAAFSKDTLLAVVPRKAETDATLFLAVGATEAQPIEPGMLTDRPDLRRLCNALENRFPHLHATCNNTP